MYTAKTTELKFWNVYDVIENELIEKYRTTEEKQLEELRIPWDHLWDYGKGTTAMQVREDILFLVTSHTIFTSKSGGRS
jgi:hypothetical protein